MKKIAFLAALLAAGMSSCSKNEVTGIITPSDNIERIGIATGVGTTRGTDMIGSSLQEHAIILSYVDSKAKPVSGALNFEFNKTSNEWGDNTDNTEWNALKLPATFYSFIDGGGNKTIAAGYTNTSATLAEAYAVTNPNPKTHSDLLYATESVSAVPAGGKIYTTFKHALSKVDLIAQVGNNTVRANYVAFKNFKSSGTPTVTAGFTNSGISWVTGSDKASYENLNRTISLKEIAYPKTLLDDATINNDAADHSATANMKVIPQTIAANYDALQAEIIANFENDPTKAEEFTYPDYQYVEVLYQMHGSKGEHVVGFLNAADHNNFHNLDTETQDKYRGKPLFAKAAFVLSNELTLKPSSYYKLNLNFNTFGGILMDDYYYDQNGDRTNIHVQANIEPGDPIIPSADTVIGITVVVDNWTTESDEDLQ